MIDKLLEKMVENAASQFMPRFQKLSQERINELNEIKNKIRTRPEEVELWFDSEITKLSKTEIKDIIKKLD